MCMCEGECKSRRGSGGIDRELRVLVVCFRTTSTRSVL